MLNFFRKYIEVFKNGHFKNVQNQKSQNTFEKIFNINIINPLKVLKESIQYFAPLFKAVADGFKSGFDTQ